MMYQKEKRCVDLFFICESNPGFGEKENGQFIDQLCFLILSGEKMIYWTPQELSIAFNLFFIQIK